MERNNEFNFSINLSALSENSTPEAWCEKGAELDKILQTYGFVWLENHGISQKNMDQLIQACRTFFNLSKEAKQFFQKPKNKVVFHGYNAMKDLTGSHIYREYFHYWPHAPNISASSCVTKEEDFAVIQPFYNAISSVLPDLRTLTQKMLKLLGISLGVGKDFFLENHTGLNDTAVGNHSYLAAINYPPLDDEGIKLEKGKHRMGQHTDWDTLTILLVDPVGGLEVLMPGGGEWVRCDSPTFCGSGGDGKFAVLMILGEYLETWSNSRYKATVHRVPIPIDDEQRQKPRLGLPFFVLPNNRTIIQPLSGNANLDFVPYEAGGYFENNFAKVTMKD